MTTTTPADPFVNLINLVAMGAESRMRLDELENSLNAAWLDMVDSCRAEYAKLQATITAAEQAITDSAELHPQWFGKTKTIKTPYGTVSYRKSSKLEVRNEEASIILLEQLGQDGLPFLKTEKRLVLEALEKLDDAELERLRIKRVTTQTLGIKYTKPDLGKAIAATAKQGPTEH